jgi:hypothetical protein
MSNISDAVDRMSLGSWLYGIRRSIDYYKDNVADIKPLVKEFVRGMHLRDLAHHWEDCPIECLKGKITEEEGILIGEIEEKLMCEEMFTYSIEFMEKTGMRMTADKVRYERKKVKPLTFVSDEDFNDLVKYPPNTSKEKQEKQEKQEKLCTCDIRDMMSAGCKCGGK